MRARLARVHRYDGAGLYSTAGDYLKFVRMILRVQWPGLPQADVLDCIERIGRVVARVA